jgi:hypothetical protein
MLMSYEIHQASVVKVPETGKASAPFMPELMRLGKLRFAYTPPVCLQHVLKRHTFDLQLASFL